MVKSNYDVLIIGGSHAGLSAAMALGRLRRDVLIVDSQKARNKVAEHANNIAGLDGVSPNEIRARGERDLKRYETVDFVHGSVMGVKKAQGHFILNLESGETSIVRKVILAFGIKDKFPSIEGFESLWGQSVFHCPYCHGFEVRDKKIGIMGNGIYVEHMVPLMKNISEELIIFTNEEAGPTHEMSEQLKKYKIEVFNSAIQGLRYDGVELKKVVLSEGLEVEVDALLMSPQIPFTLNSAIAEELGCERDDWGLIVTNESGETTSSGVFAAGDIMSKRHSVLVAMANGQIAGSSAAFELSREDFEKRV
ncbi:MAG: NAD(P)/FAD-dependent oxidoreductase [Bdellovibrionota bacterium]|nr:NAD(P)/FAD-dependent oxidoreductase [Bdellovibrionota bacterium]